MRNKVLFLALSSFIAFQGPVIASATATGSSQNSVKLAAKPAQKPAPRRLFNSKTKVLSNGLNVVVIEDHTVPRVSVGVLYHVGSADDPAHMVGISHMTEHMFWLFPDSKRFPNASATIEALGGYTNAYTSSDYTYYIMDAPVAALGTMLAIGADGMANFKLLNQKAFDKEHMAVMEERLMRIDNQPLGTADEFISNALAPDNPYGKMVIGTPENIANYTVDAVNQHYKRWYKPNNATLVVIGDVNAEEVFLLAQKEFGRIPRGPVPERRRNPEVAKEGMFQKITCRTDKVKSPKVVLSYRDLHQTTDSFESIIALEIGLTALEDNLFEFPRRFTTGARPLATWFGVSNFGPALGPVPLDFSAELMPGVTPKQFCKAFRKELEKVLKHGLRREDFERAKRGYLVKATYARTDGGRERRMYFIRCAMGFTVDQIEAVPQIIEAVTYEQTMEAIRKVLSAEPFAMVQYLPSSSKPKTQKTQQKN